MRWEMQLQVRQHSFKRNICLLATSFKCTQLFEIVLCIFASLFAILLLMDSMRYFTRRIYKKNNCFIVSNIHFQYLEWVIFFFWVSHLSLTKLHSLEIIQWIPFNWHLDKLYDFLIEKSSDKKVWFNAFQLLYIIFTAEQLTSLN